MSNDNVYQIITDQIIAQLEAGTAPWRQPWKLRDWPRSIRGHKYRGVNVFLTAYQGYTSPYWLTRKEINQRGGTIRTDERHTKIVFWKMLRVSNEDDPEQTKTIPLLRYFRVWNLEQIDGINAPLSDEPEPEPDLTPQQRHRAATEIVAGYPDRPTITERGDEAYYVPSTDQVFLPPRARFYDLDGFYAATFHELGHSTGHRSRLNRWAKQEDKPGAFGGHAYGREELIAEMTATYLCSEAGIEQTMPNHAAYLASWINTIREDVRAVVVAAGAAQRAADHILGRSFKNTETTAVETAHKTGK